MKIKADFVTNSSSSCYIIKLPKDFKIYNEYSEINDKIELYLNELKTFGDVQFGCWAEYNFELNPDDRDEFNDTIRENIIESEFLIYEIEDCGADNPDRIININSDELKEKFNKIPKDLK